MTPDPLLSNPGPDLDAYGWSDRWRAVFAEHGDVGRRPARVVRHDGSALTVTTGAGEPYQVAWRSSVPATTVGDWVALAPDDDVVEALLPRASLLARRDPTGGEQLLAANVDVVGVVCGMDRPRSTGRIDRFVALAWDAGAVPVLVLTKVDTVSEADLAAAVEELATAAPGVDTVSTSSVDGRGLDGLRHLLVGRTGVLVGESGAGKSTLVNALIGDAVAATGAVRDGDAKGRHTTSFRQLHLVAGGVLIDTPGLRSVGLLDGVEAVDETFPDIEALAEDCRFRDCAHGGEPGCAVTAAVGRGELAADRLATWARLRHEAIAEARRAEEHLRRQHDRSFSRVVKDAQERKGKR
jgi:ribosome biogenesis GTPase